MGALSAELWAGVDSMTWTGWDGSVWDLLGRDGGVSLQSGTRGLGMPGVDRFRDVSPALAGSRWRGWRAQEREVFWPVHLRSVGGSQEWMDYDRAFWRTLHPEKPGVWEVVQLDGTVRRLTCRYDDDENVAFDVLPSVVGSTVYGVHLVAEQPYWEGATLRQEWGTDTTQPFFGGVDGAGKATPFYISAGSTAIGASVSNPGDVDAYPIYTVSGPVDSVTIGYGPNTVSLGSIPAGEYRIIDTRPDQLTVTDQNGNDKWGDLTGNPEFDAPIPPGESVPLTVNVVGLQGLVSCELTPLYFRAW